MQFKYYLTLRSRGGKLNVLDGVRRCGADIRNYRT